MNFDKLFALAKQEGIEDVQVYYAAGTEFEIEVFNTTLEKYTIADTASLRVKGIYDGKMGTVSTEEINEDIFPFLVDSVVASAKAITSEDEVFIYEGDKEYKELDYLYNKSLDDVSAADKINDTLKLEELIKAQDKRISMVQAFYGDGANVVRIENSKGLKLRKEVNSAMLGAFIIATDGTDQRSVFEYKLSNDYADFNLEEMAKEGAEKAVALLGSSPVKSGTYEILLKNTASCSLLAPHVSMFSAESVQKDVSLLKGKVGEVIGSDLITLVDDPFMLKSSRSGAFDDEGVATRYKELIQDGKLTGFLHNLKTAKKDNTESTGNGFNAIRPTNFYFKAGELDYDDAVKSMKKGLIITALDGTHAGCSPISGDFSLQASGFLVEDGEIVRPVNLITIAGNYLTLLQDVTAVCSDLKFNYGFVGSPSLLIKSLQVSGE
ncbi:TldD/PmbA family protein [Candidatus Xianfuyuplasma coldseepsis]|uniref:TldD/PmbA family protein n=1 Tax=Candidatus Xianfuyuplasma coldseepsis TaxID=2782163 RepID=A0A7L7KQZ7_9MOLU|nr:TldD/PmbA family protein [Xianfuyuplasma coldseepsis]QMS84995.1 TldD/PmbA family protein [Xianfuyuplasma coldseepsis]